MIHKSDARVVKRGDGNPKVTGLANLQPPSVATASSETAAQAPAFKPPLDRPPMASSDTANSASGDERLRTAAMSLLQMQCEMRKVRSLAELGYFVANEARPLLRAQQIIVFERGMQANPTVCAVSSLTTVDRTSPVILWFESLVKGLGKDFGLAQAHEFDAEAFHGDFESTQQSYPLRNFVWVPWLDADGGIAGGMLLTRSTPWTDQDIKLAKHLSGAFAHAWCALRQPTAKHLLSKYVSRRFVAITAALLVVLLFFPVSMSALAPVEVAPRNPLIVTSGVEGVVKSVLVEPNSSVRAGQVLITLADIVFKNRLEIAEREVLVAETKHKRASQLAFSDARGRHEMAVTNSELNLKLAERDYARELLDRTEIKAERDGFAFFADKKDLVGRPVAVGEKLMEIANTDTAEFHIELPVADAIVLHPGAKVKVFLDSDPLNPISAILVRSSYKAMMRETQQLAFRLVAQTEGPGANQLRLGVRGTAQVYSNTVALGFYLFRRPIAAARQWTGL